MTAEAIAAVTLVLQDLLKKVVADIGIGPPDKGINDEVDVGLNLYLWHVQRSGRWQNFVSPQAGRPGHSPAPVAVVLRYLLTAFGKGEPLNHAAPQSALESALGLLADTPVLTRERVRKVLPNSALARQVEPIRVGLGATDPTDLFHAWSLFQTPYRTSAVVEVEVVLIESTTVVPVPPPVRVRNDNPRPPDDLEDFTGLGLDPVPRLPTIASVETGGGATERAFALGERVVFRGHHLGKGDVIRFTPAFSPDPDADSVFVRVTVADLSDEQLTVTLAVAAGPWRAGAYRAATMPKAADPLNPTTDETESNAVVFDLLPRITKVKEKGGAESTDPGGGGPIPVLVTTAQGAARVVELTVTAEPPIRAGQRAVLMMNGRAVPASPPGHGAETKFEANNVVAGAYWLRLRVDGVESRLIDRTDPPTYRGFRVEVT